MAVNLTISRPIKVNVNEIFGATIQGEGRNMGRRCAFLRFAGCNLSCSWCDTPYSWDWDRFDKSKESHPMSVEEIAEQIKMFHVKHLIITGGEPLIQQRPIPMIKELTGCSIEIETNGTRVPRPEVIEAVETFNVSPKLSFASDPEESRIKEEAMMVFSDLSKKGKAIFKFVAEKVEDFAEIREIQARFNIDNDAIWIMPEGMTIESHLAHLRELADPIIEEGWNLTTRIHVLAWEQKRSK